MNENPLRQGMRTPIMSMGVIAGKVHPDTGHIQQCMANADDPNIAKECYPGGGKDVHHDILPGDFSIGEKCVRDFSNGFNELGFVAVNGLYTGNYNTHREMQSNFYPQGVAVTECRTSNPMDNPMAQDPDHGYAIVKAGTVPTLNNGPYTLYPNTFVSLRFPPSNLFDKQAETTGDIKFGDSNHRARTGTFPGQLRPELVPFDYTDFAIHYDSAYHLMGIPQSKGGISDISFADVLRKRKAYVDDSSQFSCEAEEAVGHYYGALNFAKAMLEELQAKGKSVADAKATLDKFASNDAADIKEVNTLVRSIFLRAYPTSIQNAGAQKPDMQTAEGQLRALGSTFHSGHVMGNHYDKVSWVVGKAMSSAGPSETLDLLLGHYTLA